MSVGLVMAVLLGLLVAVGVATAALRDPLAATVVFAAYSLTISMLWVVLQAPDVGLTEAAVGAGVTTSLFVVTIIETTRPVGETAFVRDVDASSIAVAGGVFALVAATIPSLPAVGNPDAPAFQRVAPYYLDHAGPAMGIDNVVTAIIVGYRGFDTFGEVVVVFAAGLASLLVVRSTGWSQ